MRESLLQLIEKTIVYQYDLPNTNIGVARTIFSTEDDKCYTSSDINNLAQIIYNLIVEYSFNEFELKDKDYNNLHAVALQTRLKYNPDVDEAAKLKYGFFGEVLLYSFLYLHFKAKPLIARGMFFSTTEKGETKGYDSYHLIEADGNTELWFGEAKFYIQYKGAVKLILDKLDVALSDSYLQSNFLAFYNHKNNFNIQGSKVETILKSWEEQPLITNMIEEIKKHNLKLVYPILLLYEQNAGGFDSSISMVIDHIKKKYTAKTPPLSINYSIFFILMPLDKVKEIKKSVITWIESKKQVVAQFEIK
jgi:Cap4 SAVED domain